ncbi:MAG: hypothetical protein R3E31_06060 [Chloroflexota bacterium]
MESGESGCLDAKGDTAVVPAHRGQGLGRWLKAAMLDKMLRERPNVNLYAPAMPTATPPCSKLTMSWASNRIFLNVSLADAIGADFLLIWVSEG